MPPTPKNEGGSDQDSGQQRGHPAVDGGSAVKEKDRIPLIQSEDMPGEEDYQQEVSKRHGHDYSFERQFHSPPPAGVRAHAFYPLFPPTPGINCRGQDPDGEDRQRDEGQHQGQQPVPRQFDISLPRSTQQ